MIQNLVEIKNEYFIDDRGKFTRIFDRNIIKSSDRDICQINISNNPIKFTLRGLHYQINGESEHKILRVSRGEIYLAIVDLRKNSSTYLNKFEKQVSSDDDISYFIPAGCATGWLSLTSNTEIIYLMYDFYENCSYSGARYDDPALDIKWPALPKVISKKDLSWNLIQF